MREQPPSGRPEFRLIEFNNEAIALLQQRRQRLMDELGGVDAQISTIRKNSETLYKQAHPFFGETALERSSKRPSSKVRHIEFRP